jgi:hypothetical protein
MRHRRTDSITFQEFGRRKDEVAERAHLRGLRLLNICYRNHLLAAKSDAHHHRNVQEIKAVDFVVEVSVAD